MVWPPVDRISSSGLSLCSPKRGAKRADVLACAGAESPQSYSQCRPRGAGPAEHACRSAAALPVPAGRASSQSRSRSTSPADGCPRRTPILPGHLSCR